MASAQEARNRHAIAGFSLLERKIVAITGSSRGIGRAISLAAAAHGASLVLHYLGDEETEAEVQTLVDEVEEMGGKAISVKGDIADERTANEIVNVAVRKFSRLDVLVSNAGICPFHSFLDMPTDLWKRVQDVNLNGSFYAVRAAANQMAKQEPRGGSIIAISSISALVGGGMQTHYTPTKAGIKSLMESCAIALGSLGIRCNAILPGSIATDINKEDFADHAKRAYMQNRSPLGRLGAPDDIAGPVVFMASDLSKFMTGSSVLVDGGMFVNLQ